MKPHGTLAEIEGAREAELVAECERLRGLLATAREGLREAFMALPASTQYNKKREAARLAFFRSDPDATAAKVSDAD